MSTHKWLTLVAALIAASAASASEPLYKWRDADGTLTFSRTPPAKNSGIAYERVGSGEGIELTQSRTSKPVAAAPAQGSTLQTQPNIQRLAPANSRRKSTQCSELQKRVLSLERLLRTDISAATMDNAIVQMARYQNSFNQSCNRTASRQ